jgi:hypothetical protein
LSRRAAAAACFGNLTGHRALSCRTDLHEQHADEHLLHRKLFGRRIAGRCQKYQDAADCHRKHPALMIAKNNRIADPRSSAKIR